MEKVPIGTLKANLAAYLAKVKAGRSLVITDRSRAVAVLEPVAWDLDQDETLKTLVLSGQLSPASEELPEAFFQTPRVQDLKARLRRFLEEERRSGW